MPQTDGPGSPTVCFAALHAPPTAIDPEEYLDAVPILREIPRALAARGYVVHVVQHFPTACRFSRGEVHYYFERASAAGAANLISGVTGRSAASFSPALRAVHTIRSLRPELIHVHGSSLHLNHRLLLATLGRSHPPVVLQYHGGYPSPNHLVRQLQRYNFDRTDRFLFTTRTHAEPFIDAGLIRDPARIIEFMETSSTFKRVPRELARRETGMTGDPVFLWAARLHPIKDPLTALRGFEKILLQRPGAQLYLYYLTDEMLPEVRTFVDSDPNLRSHVHFRGPAPFDRMELIYNSADFLLQASLHEFSGCAVLEAMSCGVIPIVTDIPSFRAMTGDGGSGVLFSPGDFEALARGVLAIPSSRIRDRSLQVREQFDSELSFSVLAGRLDEIYRDVLTRPVPPPFQEIPARG